ncbi:MAG TPA: hypothetical protein VK453_09155 [Micromonosporaceae bacterium]|nr:hypothetical protein [Micromonosporaceae bacterium]
MIPTDRHVRRYIAPLAAAVALTVTGCATTTQQPTPAVGNQSAGASRQGEIAERGRSVMPFDLERTTHRFTKTTTGGVQAVVADTADATQVGLIQQHLRHEAERFRSGDFEDPASIHGADMPGLAALRQSAGKITVTYHDISDGARITYTTADTALISALHSWFDAQVSDHGRHATHS